MDLRNLSLFSGVGGLEIAARLVGSIRTVCYVESDPYCQAVLMSRIRDGSLDDAPIWDDARTFEGKHWKGRADIVSGGFPCQPFSFIGAKKKLSDERSLFQHILRIALESESKYILAENVSGILVPDVLYNILEEFETKGFCARPYRISACSVGAPHMRWRVFFLAHSKSVSRFQANTEALSKGIFKGTWENNLCESWREMARPDWQLPASWILRDIDGVPNRLDRARCTGNGVVPFQAVPAWEAILKMAEI